MRISDVVNRGLMETSEEWRQWTEKIPYIDFPKSWKVRIIPPFAGAMIRFLVTKEGLKNRISIYLDCYDKLGCYGEPYWEVYPVDGDIFRCDMNNIPVLLMAIKRGLRQLKKEAKNDE